MWHQREGVLCSDWSPQWTFIPSSPHQLWNPWRKRSPGVMFIWGSGCCGGSEGKDSSWVGEKHKFAFSCCESFIAVLPSAVNPSSAAGQGGGHGVGHAFGRQMCHAVAARLWITLSVCPSWRGCNPRTVVSGFLHSSKPCGWSAPCILTSPHTLVWSVCQAHLKCDANHLSPGVAELVSTASCHSHYIGSVLLCWCKWCFGSES